MDAPAVSPSDLRRARLSAFDALPPRLRRALAAHALPLDARRVAARLKRGVSEARILKELALADRKGMCGRPAW